MSFLRKLYQGNWTIGFVRGGLQSIMENDHYEVDWVKLPRDRWFADPFILDVTDDEILVLVEDYAYKLRKGVISLLHIDRLTTKINSRKVVLEIPTHLSFPNILRKNGKVYVYPESANSGKLVVYRFDEATETLVPCSTICDDCIWDSDISELFGEALLFTAAHNDRLLDIYSWNKSTKRFVPWKTIPSEKKNSRLGGALFTYKGNVYYPAQDCENGYGSAIIIKKIDFEDGEFTLTNIKRLNSTHPKFRRGLHTLNHYRDIVVIDVHGYRFGVMGKILLHIIVLIKKLISI